MEAWADDEAESAPELRPTADMYRMVRARKKQRPAFLTLPRWATAGAAVAGLMVLAILYALLIHPSIHPDFPPGQQVALVGQREGFVAEKGVVVRGTVVPGGKGGRKGPIAFRQLVLHFQKQDSRFVEGVNLQALPDERIALTAADNYRLLLEPSADWTVYVFQLTSSNILVKFFPNEAYSAVRNPLRQGQTYYLPSGPNWFYLGQEEGQESLYVIASAEPMPDLEDLYARYSQADDESREQELLSSLLERLDAVREVDGEGMAGWVLVFDHQ